MLTQDFGHGQLVSSWIQGLAVILALALSAGYQTPIAALVGLLFHALIWSQLGVDSVAEVIIFSLDALALALLGPGAYSVDGYRFGRRVVVLPP